LEVDGGALVAEEFGEQFGDDGVGDVDALAFAHVVEADDGEGGAPGAALDFLREPLIILRGIYDNRRSEIKKTEERRADLHEGGGALRGDEVPCRGLGVEGRVEGA